jgi:hypothetical protein
MFWKTIYREQLNRSTYPARLPLPALDWLKKKGRAGETRDFLSAQLVGGNLEAREDKGQAHDV